MKKMSKRSFSVTKSNLPLNFGLEMFEFLKELLPFIPLGQIAVTPVFHHFLQLIGIETILKAHTFQRFLQFQRTIQLCLQIGN